MTSLNPYEAPETPAHRVREEAPISIIEDVSADQAELVRTARAMRPWQCLLLVAVLLTAVRWVWALTAARMQGEYLPLGSRAELLDFLWCLALVWLAVQLALVVRASSLLRSQGRPQRIRRFCQQLALLCVAGCVCVGLVLCDEVMAILAILYPRAPQS